MVLEVPEAIEVFRDLAKFPCVTGGHISNLQAAGHVYVESFWTQRDLERGERVKFSRGHIVQLDVVQPTSPQVIGTAQWNVEAPSGRLRAIVRKVSGKKDKEDQQFIEVWSESRLVQNVDVQGLEQHGKIYEDGTFGCLVWSHSETHLLYVAEKKKPKAKSFFDRKAGRDIESGAEDITQGEEYVYEEHWGEQLTGKVHPVVCVLDIEAGAVSVLDNLPDHVSAGQAVWCPDDLGVVCVGWHHQPYRLGVIYCPIRRSSLYHIDLKTFQCSELGERDRAVRSPRFSPDHRKLLYLDNRVGGPHMQCSRLMMIDWSTKGVVCVVDEVDSPAEGEFTGLYPGLTGLNLATRCMANDNRRLITDTQWRSKTELVCIDCETGQVVRMTDDPLVGGWSLIDIRDDLILASCSSPIVPQYLVIGQLPKAGSESSITWAKLDSNLTTIPDITWKILPMQVPESGVNPKYPDLDYECVLVQPSDKSRKSPLVVCPHGGPHSVFGAEFVLMFTALARCGFSVLLINYRGSTGFGAATINSVPGNIGTQDVGDCQWAVEKVLDMGVADPDNVVVIGGSHGGFLTCHLIGQYPDFYKAAVARNAVTNLVSMTGLTDILDWTYTNVGRDFEFGNCPDTEMYTRLHQVSPLRLVDEIKTPLMLMIGEKDQRVPPKQSVEMQRALVARGVKVRMLSYPECEHPINEVKSEADAFVNIVSWFRQHITN